MKKLNLKKLSIMTAIIALVLCFTLPAKDSTAAIKGITAEEYIKQLVIATKLKVDTTVQDPYIAAAIASGLVVEGEFTNYKNTINRTDAAVLTSRADELLNGKEYSEKLYYEIIQKNRISDLNKITKEKQGDVVKVFLKGLMVGNSNGSYSQNRSFKGNQKLTKSEMTDTIKRLTKKNSRYKISPDGQLIRTTRLPKNYKKFEYILASFPNSFYEKKFLFETTNWGKTPTYLEDYCTPKDLKKTKFENFYSEYKMSDVLEKYQDKWCEKVEQNLYYRLNFDYRTVNKDWINGLRQTYSIYDYEELDSKYDNAIKQYVKIAKANKVAIKTSKISVEPSSMYHCSGTGIVVRCHVRFKITSATKFYSADSGDQRLMIYGSYIYLKNLKKNTWYEADFDIGLSGVSASETGSGYAVTSDYLY